MANYEVVVPKLGESIIEATITKWLKNVGEFIHEDEPIVEIATDKVDSEIPSPVSGKLIKQLFNEGDIVPVGTSFAIIDATNLALPPNPELVAEAGFTTNPEPQSVPGARFYSPLVRNIVGQARSPSR